MSSQDDSQIFWTHKMEVSPTSQFSPTPGPTSIEMNLNALTSLQAQSLEIQRQILDNSRQMLELTRESAQFIRDQRARQIADLERWQSQHKSVLGQCEESLANLEQVHASLMQTLSQYIHDNQENLLDNDYVLGDFVDRFGSKIAHLNTMLAILRPLAASKNMPKS